MTIGFWFSLGFLILNIQNCSAYYVVIGDPVAASTYIVRNGPLQNEGANYTWQEEYYKDMPIDHFSFADNRTFQLRYFINLDSYKSGGPILFYTGNEGGLEGFATNTGLMWDIAPELKAAVVFAEHRFYGKTQPFGNDSYTKVNNLGYLSSEQALADFVELIQWLKVKRIPESSKSPVIAFGGSYGGMLAAWIRTKYPHVVQGSIAASAPVFWFVNANVRPDIYSYITTRTFKTSGCNVKNIKAAFTAITELAETEEGRSQLNKVFKLSEKSRVTKKEDAVVLINFISETMKGMVMIDYPYPANFLAPLPGWPVQVACKKFGANPTLFHKKNLKVLVSVLSVYYNSSGQTDSYCIDPAKCPSPYAQLGDPLGWPWQTCTEMVMPMCDSGLPNDFFPKNCPFKMEDFVNSCKTSFESIGWSSPLLRPNWAIDNYGSEFPTASNIVFSNGKLDPWSGGGWSYVNERKGSLVSVILEQGAHHYDLRGIHPKDTDEVKAVRRLELDEIQKWIHEYRSRQA